MATSEVIQSDIAAICELFNGEIREILSKSRRISRKCLCWIRKLIQRRNKLGVLGTLLKKQTLGNMDAYKNYLRVFEEKFFCFLHFCYDDG